MSSPKFIVFDGPDGSGKSTQVKLLADRISKDREVLVLDHPDKQGFGAELRRLKFEEKKKFPVLTEAYLHAADFVEMLETRIRPALAVGTTVICHRWWSSALVYQASIDAISANGDLRRMVMQLYDQAISHAWGRTHCPTHWMLPDVAIFLRVSPERAMERLNLRPHLETFRYEREEQVKKACEAFDWVVTYYAESGTDYSDPIPKLGVRQVVTGNLARSVLTLDTTDATPEETHSAVCHALALA